MSWLQSRKARKTLKNIGLSKSQIDETTSELKQGMKSAKKMRKELRKLESPTYDRLITKINQIADSDAPTAQKKEESFNLVVTESNLSDYEKTDLLQQLNGMYGSPRTAEEERKYVIDSLKKIKQGAGTKDEKIQESVTVIENSFIPYDLKADLMVKVTSLYNHSDQEKTIELNNPEQEEQSEPTPLIGKDISWASVYKMVFDVLDFDRNNTQIIDDKVVATSKSEPYGFLLVNSPLLNQPATLPIIHKDDFWLAASIFDEQKFMDAINSSAAELLVTYAPKRINRQGFALSAAHSLHYVLAPKSTVDEYYSDEKRVKQPEPEVLFGDFVYSGELRVGILD